MASVALSPLQKDALAMPSFLSGQHGYLTNESILIYLTLGGSVIPIRVLESDSVASVKLRIQNHKGFFVKNQKLVFGGRALTRDNSCVRDYGVVDGTVVHLVLSLSNVQAIIVKTVCGKEFEFHVERSKNVEYLKKQIAEKGKGFFDLSEQELFCDGEELQDQCQIQEYCKKNDDVIHLLIRKSAKVRAKPIENDFEVLIVASNPNEKGVNRKNRDLVFEPLISNPKIKLPLVIKEMVSSTFRGLINGNKPVRSSEGCGGAYFMLDSSGREYVSVFKPLDEEPMAVNNPTGLPESKDGEGLKKGTQVGQGAIREVAAYLLDHPKTGTRSLYNLGFGFAGIPPTTLVKCLDDGFYHPNGYDGSSRNVKIGSLQMYMKNCGSCEDIGPGSFPIEEVHKISVLDIRLANVDRHGGNILVSRDHEGRIVLIPIDHGYCLPSKFEDCTFDWLYWPQARHPYSHETIKYIESLDVEDDIKLLKLNGWEMPPECARVFRVSTMLLKKGASRNLTPFSIGSIMCRETLKKKSVIELIIEEVEESLLLESSESEFLEAVSLVMDRWLDEISS